MALCRAVEGTKMAENASKTSFWHRLPGIPEDYPFRQADHHQSILWIGKADRGNSLEVVATASRTFESAVEMVRKIPCAE